MIKVVGGQFSLVADGHTFLDDPFHAAHTDAQFVLDQFADSLYAAVAQVVDIVCKFVAVVDADHALDQFDNIAFADRAVCDRNEFLQSPVSGSACSGLLFQGHNGADQKLFLEELFGIFKCGGVARAHALEELKQGCHGDGLLVE